MKIGSWAYLLYIDKDEDEDGGGDDDGDDKYDDVQSCAQYVVVE